MVARVPRSELLKSSKREQAPWPQDGQVKKESEELLCHDRWEAGGDGEACTGPLFEDCAVSRVVDSESVPVETLSLDGE